MSSVADRMRRRREELGMSLPEVQAALRIHRRHLGALESGRLEAIPGGQAHASGFMRAYANFLGLDGTALLGDFRREAAEREAAAATAVAEPARAGSRSAGGARQAAWRTRPRAVAAVAAAVLLVAGGALALRARSAPGASAPPAAAQSSRPAAGSVHPPARPAQGVADTGAVAGGGSPGSGGGGAGLSHAAPAPAAPAAAGRATAPAAPAAGRPPVTVSSSTAAGGLVTYTVHGAPALTVRVTASAPCWFRISPDGSAQFTQGMLRAGGSAAWTASGSLRVRLGFPEGVHLKVDGVALAAIPLPSPVDLVFVRQPAP